jgi:hypothetical protein
MMRISNISLEPKKDGTLVKCKNIFNQNVAQVIPLTTEELTNYFAGKLGDLQIAFPELSDEQREFLITGLSGAQFDAIMG